MEQVAITSSKQPVGLTSESYECLMKVLFVSDKQREIYFMDHSVLEEIRKVCGKEAPTIIAALLVGNSKIIWDRSAARGGRVTIGQLHKESFGYISQFVSLMEKRLAETNISPIYDEKFFLCFESVFCAMYLGGMLKADSIVKLFAKSLDTSKNPIYQANWKNFSLLWGVLTGSGTLNYVIPKDVPAHKEFLEAGRLIFMGPMKNEHFEDNVPWHVGVTVGNGFFVGMPGLGSVNQQVHADIALYTQAMLEKTSDKKYAVALGSPLVDLTQRVEDFIAQK